MNEPVLEFYPATKAFYMHEFFSVPNNIDLHKIEKMHHNVHGMNRMLGLLDCSQLKWKNCPKAWAGSYQSMKTLPQLFLRELQTIICFLECLLDGSFGERERRSGVVPFKIVDEEFNNKFVLVDGIYHLAWAHP
ncbi:hypothetical protein ACHAXS_009708 [Conticribra weissflogii]